MTGLVLAAAFFAGLHLFVAGTRLRAVIAAQTGERGFRGLFSLLSLVGLVWLARAYAAAEPIALWGPVEGFRPVALVLVAVAFVLATAGVTTPSPTAVGGERLLSTAEPARGILRITRHPAHHPPSLPLRGRHLGGGAPGRERRCRLARPVRDVPSPGARRPALDRRQATPGLRRSLGPVRGGHLGGALRRHRRRPEHARAGRARLVADRARARALRPLPRPSRKAVRDARVLRALPPPPVTGHRGAFTTYQNPDRARAPCL